MRECKIILLEKEKAISRKGAKERRQENIHDK
jgi:hypothetical protein